MTTYARFAPHARSGSARAPAAAEREATRPLPWAPWTNAPAPPPSAPWCRIVQHPDAYTLQFGGGEPAGLRQRLEALKGAIPAQRRRWNPVTRTWWVDPVLENLFRVVSRWADCWFSPGQVQRLSATASAADEWTTQTETGDSVAEGWVAETEAGGAAPQRRVIQVPAEGAADCVSRPQPAPPPPPAGLAVQDALAAAYATLWLRPGAPAAVVKAAYRALAALHHPDTGGDGDAMRRLNAAYAQLQREGG